MSTPPKPSSTGESLGDLLTPHAEAAEADLQRWLVEPGTPDALAEAMRYCALGAGKRLRPALVRLAAECVGADADDEGVRRAAVAIELVHCYSLVHDDLPAMDDDTLRRGQPTCHVKFGEAMAILVGDALLTRAFGILAEGAGPHVAQLTAELARAAGGAGMVAGQVADLALCDLPDGATGLTYIHERKTAALIQAAIRMGAIAGGADETTQSALNEFGRLLGLAFQAVDDVLDATGEAETLGKTPGKDARHGKRTLVSELGLDAARGVVDELSQQALARLASLGDGAQPLRLLTTRLAERTY